MQFAEHKSVHNIPHVNDFSEAQIRDSYFSPRELRNIRAECIDIVSYTNEKGVEDGDGFFLRGLDQHTLRYKKTQDSMCRQLYDTVKAFQDFQDQTGVDVSERMAKLCQKFSAPAASAAQVSAMSDIFSAFKGSWTRRGTPVIQDIPTRLKQKNSERATARAALIGQ